MSVLTAPSSAIRTDARLEAFCAPDGPEVFSAVTHSHQVWTPDPFDVPTIHADAREMFARLVRRAASQPLPTSGKCLLLLGEAGSGKTHLMRAFRNSVHADGTAYCGYLQLVTRSENYARYILSTLLDALSQPYRALSETSGLARLAGGLLDALDNVPETERRRLREEELSLQELAVHVHMLADAALQVPRFSRLDLDFLRAMFFLLSNDARIRARIMKWLRCEDLSRMDSQMLGDLVPRPQEHMPLRTMVDLGRLMATVHQSALVLCVDQLEETVNLGSAGSDPGEVFRRVTETLITITDVVPTAVVVVACLEDYFTTARQYLAKPKLDRLEQDPQPIRLGSKRSEEEIETIISRRLEQLYDAFDLTPDPAAPTFPFREEHLRPLYSLRTRDILNFCRQHHERCLSEACWVEPSGDHAKPEMDRTEDQEATALVPLEQHWNDHRANYKAPLIEDEDRLAELLAWSIQHVSGEMPAGIHFGVENDGRFVPVEMHVSENGVEKVLTAICEKKTQGGGLGRQIEEVAKRAGELPAVLVRSSPFPDSPKTAVAKQIASLMAPKGKGRRVEVQNADWRVMAAYREFNQTHHQDPQFVLWQQRQRPLASLPSLSSILSLNRWTAPNAPVTRPQPTKLPAISAAKTPLPAKPPIDAPAVVQELHLGLTRGTIPGPVQIKPLELAQHAACLGGSGSGKTTVALAIIEQLLAEGIPAVLIDRKGDLARYADPAAWEVNDENKSRIEKRRRLKERLDVALYTPGDMNGRPLFLPLAPADLSHLPTSEREQICSYAAAALGGMMGYKQRGIDPKLAILGKAIEVLASLLGHDITVRSLHKLIIEQDESLLLAVGGFEAKHYKKLAEDLLSLSIQRQRLLDGGGEALDVDTLLGRRGDSGKTRLSIISTQFLGDANAIDFWLAQFLVAVDRWRSRNPSPQGRLQAVFLFDEADKYLPALSQPATKAPMEDLLRRGRSAGIGLFLATQSPGDLDYRCRDQIRLWLLGRVKEPTAINKLKPMLEGKPEAVAKLAGQGPGQFYLVREREVLPVLTERSLMDTVQLPQERILELARKGIQ